MNGPEHYREAERLVRKAAEVREERGGGQFGSHVMWTAEAQVHATLALSAEKNSGPPWTQESVTRVAAELRELRAAVREHLIARDTPPYMDEMTIVRLRGLVKDLTGGAS